RGVEQSPTPRLRFLVPRVEILLERGQRQQKDQPSQTDRPLHAPSVKFAFSFVEPAAASNASSETSKAKISSSVISIPSFVLFMATSFLSPAAPAVRENFERPPS